MSDIKWTELGATPQEAMNVINNLKPGRPVTPEERKRGVVAHFEYPEWFTPVKKEKGKK